METIFDDLKHIDLFSGLAQEELICKIQGDVVYYKRGDILFHEGDEAHSFYVVLDGDIQTYRLIEGERLPIMVFTKGMTGGEQSLLAGTPHPEGASALTDTKLLVINEENFWSMIGSCPLVRKRILANMAERTQALQALSFQREKLISLGTISAGLAHELNNPASAALSAAQNLVRTLEEFDRHSSSMLKQVMFKELKHDAFPFKPITDAFRIEEVKLDPVARSMKEDEMLAWLEKQGVEEAWDVAPTLVATGYSKEMLEDFVEKLVPDYKVNFLNWLHQDMEMRLLSNELLLSTKRMSDLVTAVKAYSHVESTQHMRITADVHEGINTTLIIMNHKLKSKNITVVKEFGENIPSICTFGSEVNQVWTNLIDVWTNLIDNAIDAVAENGLITLRTYRDINDKNMISIEVIDNGSGVPKEIEHRIFEPFFTTKDVGKGTGIGLELVHRIVIQHHGFIRLESRPGYTCFKVCLPVAGAEGC